MRPAEKATIDIVDYGKLAIVAMIMITLVYMVAKELFGLVPAKVGTIIMGIALIFIYATNKRVREQINLWLKKK